jgi:flagellar biosynthetic protein FliR/FlhB
MISDSVLHPCTSILRHSLENGLNRTVTQGNMTSIFLQDSGIYLRAVLPMMGAVMVIGIMASLLQTGFIRSLDPLKPDLKQAESHSRV